MFPAAEFYPDVLNPEEFVRSSLADAIPEPTLDSEAADLLRRLSSDFSGSRWVFRGHADASWKLQPTLERLPGYQFPFVADKQPLELVEEDLERQFQRRAHLYVAQIPPEPPRLEWFALMRHYGAPTRLLDFTRLPYIAAFFACQGRPTPSSQNPEGFSAIWAIDAGQLNSTARRGTKEPLLSYDCTFDNLALATDRPALVIATEPFRMNERLTNQQGLFLCSNALAYPLETSLKYMLWKADHYDRHKICRKRIAKLVIHPDARPKVIRELFRMNISWATLTPGLGGFAQSLETNVWNTELLEAIREKKGYNPADNILARFQDIKLDETAKNELSDPPELDLD